MSNAPAMAEDRSPASGFEPDAILPSQLLDTSHLGAARQPEKRLMLAVLEDGIATFQRTVSATTRAARREFEEETGIHSTGPFIPLGSIRQKAGKTIHAWGFEGDADPAAIVSNTMRTEWPRGSGRWIEFPEVDRCGWFDPAAAKEKMNPAQAELIDRLEAALVAHPIDP